MASDEIQLKDDPNFQRREWAVQRIASWLIVAFVVAAALGFFGSGGIFSHGRANADDGKLWIDYERFVRAGASARLKIHSAAGIQDLQHHEVRLNRGFFDAIRTERILPEPRETLIGSDKVTFRFTAEAWRSGASLILDYQPQTPGRQVIAVQVDQAPPVSFTQFTYF
jgi:hypothetical protein